jgi:hypothetical protein
MKLTCFISHVIKYNRFNGKILLCHRAPAKSSQSDSLICKHPVDLKVECVFILKETVRISNNNVAH